MTKKDNNNKKLIQVRLLPQAISELEEMKKETGLTFTEVVKFSITLFKWAIEQQKKGFEIYAIPSENKKGTESGEKVKLLIPV